MIYLQNILQKLESRERKQILLKSTRRFSKREHAKSSIFSDKRLEEIKRFIEKKINN